MSNPLPPRGLVIRQPWIDRILSGDKQWELRGKPTQVRGPIALIQGGSCTVVGTARVAQVIGPLDPEALRTAADEGKIGADEAATQDYPQTYAWVLEDVQALPQPVPYRHPRGAITWVRLEGAVAPAPSTASRRPGPR